MANVRALFITRGSKTIPVFALLLPAIVAIASAGNGHHEPESTAQAHLASLKWLEGTWAGNGFETHYTSPKGGLILSLSKFLEGDEVRFYEFERIEVRGNDVVLTPQHPGDTGSVSFTLTGYNPAVKKALFVNRAHDFPKEISFELRSRDNLLIVVSGDEGGSPQTINLDLRRGR